MVILELLTPPNSLPPLAPLKVVVPVLLAPIRILKVVEDVVPEVMVYNSEVVFIAVPTFSKILATASALAVESWNNAMAWFLAAVPLEETACADIFKIEVEDFGVIAKVIY